MKALARGILRVFLGVIAFAVVCSALLLLSLIAMYWDRRSEAA
jgi:hypothetical protein